MRTLLGLCIALLISCGDPAGTPCQTTGSGFTASHDCQHRCLSRWQVECPNGDKVTPGTCSGAFACSPGSCPVGQVCYHDVDPFDDRSFCVMADTCGDLSEAALTAWELQTVARQSDVIAARLAQQARRQQWQAQNPDKLKTAPAQATPAQSTQSKSNQSQAALTCEATQQRHGFEIAGQVSGDQEFVAALPNGWQFVLLPTNYGWAIRVYDQPYTNGRVDLSAITPPMHLPVNPREIAGWHFRNQANTGPNLGDVNAPQRLRLFHFDGALAGTGGLRQSGGAISIDPDSGRGALTILDYQLTDLQAQRARMTSLNFQACLTWPRLSQVEETARAIEHERRARELDAQVLTFLGEEQEMFGRCGLDTSRYKLAARVTPRLLGLDIDADGAHDEVVQVARLADDRRGLALCRAGTWLHLLGFDQTFDGPTQHLLSAMEAWRVLPPDHGRLGFVDEPEWPAPAGDVLLVERLEKGMAMFFWRDGTIRTQKVYGMVPR